jgi:hypothetical protein
LLAAPALAADGSSTATWTSARRSWRASMRVPGCGCERAGASGGVRGWRSGIPVWGQHCGSPTMHDATTRRRAHVRHTAARICDPVAGAVTAHAARTAGCPAGSTATLRRARLCSSAADVALSRRRRPPGRRPRAVRSVGPLSQRSSIIMMR